MPKGKPLEWTPEMDSLLGRMLDTEAAKRLGLWPSVVARRRKMLGIPVNDRIPIEALPLLGEVSDKEIAKRHGVSRVCVTLWRKRLGINSLRSTDRGKFAKLLRGLAADVQAGRMSIDEAVKAITKTGCE